MKVGDKIKITNDGNNQGEYFSIGHVATLCGKDLDGDWWADFNNEDNSFVDEGGIWCVGSGVLNDRNMYQFEVVV